MGKGKKASSDAKDDTAPSAAPVKTDTRPKKQKKANTEAAQAPAAPAAAAAAATAAPEGKPSSKKRASKDEIDAIFATAKSKPAESKPAEQLNPELQELAAVVGAARQAAQASGKRPKVEGSKDDIFGESPGKARKRTEEGYAVYSEDELGLGKRGGDTPLCPFDCDCCF